ncbi:hypothetical protein SUGI_0711860 [Cryptomeria japonica]|nr:hypothetical protein SUGI_0711860 [Cryptomeria japonica]
MGDRGAQIMEPLWGCLAFAGVPGAHKGKAKTKASKESKDFLSSDSPRASQEVLLMARSPLAFIPLSLAPRSSFHSRILVTLAWVSSNLRLSQITLCLYLIRLYQIPPHPMLIMSVNKFVHKGILK